MNCESMVYLNKVFTNLEARSCPLLGELIAGVQTFEQQLSFYEPADENGCGCGCGCGCGGSTCLDFDGDLNFVIDSTQVFVSDFNLETPGDLTAADVTVNGVAVDALDFFNERYMASTNALMSQISNCACLERGVSTKAMLLIREAGPWVAKITIVIHGSVFGCGGCKKFKLVMSTLDEVSIDIPGTSTFAVTDICLPCTTGGIAPIINFSFKAKASLLNPSIIVDTGGGTCNVILTGALVTEPIAAIQVTRQTLFSIDAATVEQPCDDLRRCNQAPGTCACEADVIPISNPCCDDGGRDRRGDDGWRGHGNGDGCSNNDYDRQVGGDRDIDCDDGCGCDNYDNDREGCNGSHGDNKRNGRAQNRQICCQFNGCNGCSF